MKLLLASVLALNCAGCLLDSVEPWLSPETIVETKIELDGQWSLLDDVEMFGSGSESFITLTHKPATPSRKEFFYIKVRPKRRDAQFVFQATVHEIENLRFLQISNFTHFGDAIFGLANRPTYSLWRFEADEDNIVIWMPTLDRKAANLKTLQDQDDHPLFVDSAGNNEQAIREWALAYRLAGERPKNLMALALTRTGTEFVVPVSAKPHMPDGLDRSKRGGK
jgi:hypothetical protein